MFSADLVYGLHELRSHVCGHTREPRDHSSCGLASFFSGRKYVAGMKAKIKNEA